jgi:Protein of unknown function (DUF3142)
MRHLRLWQVLVLTLAPWLTSESVFSDAIKPWLQQAYVWQRDWTPAVREAIAIHANQFNGLVVLNAEVTWSGHQPKLVRVPLDYKTLKVAGCSVGLALRVGSYPGPFQAGGEPIRSLAELAASLVQEARANDLGVSELQIDFDCAESKLAGYQTWVQAIQARVAPCPVSITVLPSWLGRPSFQTLVSAAGSYVLQVHSLEKAKGIQDSFSLCDCAAARRAVERAESLNVPFRVALPTYGYVMAFDSAGKFIGLSADGLQRPWPDGVRVREVRADPGSIAQLVAFWSTNRPASMQGLIWYRLPTEADALNWPWATLAAVMQGRSPRGHWRALSTRVEPGLIEISLFNDGELDQTIAPTLLARWREGPLISADALQGYDLTNAGLAAVRFEPKPGAAAVRLGPGKKRTVGWLRLKTDQEVQIEISKSDVPHF